MRQIGQGLLLVGLAACGQSDNIHDASGNFEANETIISSEASGKIMRFNIEEGSTLKAGEAIGYIDTTQLFLRKRQLLYSIRAVLAKQPDAASQLSMIEKQIETANYEKKRVENLLKDDAATKKQLDDLSAQVDLLQKQHQALEKSLEITTQSIQSETLPLKAQVEQLEDQLAKSVIVNPVAGTVLAKYAEAAEVVTAGKPLYKIADMSSLLLRAYVSGDQLSSIKIGQQLKILIDDVNGGTKQFMGMLEWVSDKAEFTPKTIQTKEERANLVYAIKVRVQNDGFLKIGMYGDVDFK